MNKVLPKLGKFFTTFVLCQSVGIIGAGFTAPMIDSWYNLLNKPWFTPPSWLFGPVWTLLYFLMGVSLYIIWTEVKPSKKRTQAMKLFFAQLGANLLWSLMFFGLQSPLLGFITIVAMWVLIALTKHAFMKLNKLAGWLLLPYLLWVSFATVLNTAILALN